ncbi:putative nuclease HARBI1 [Clytia hemisphaerica]|uniref:putative nuclease HARBI1 n=1 Tax=Clytia hemisphaerica TaxID=252671 RepID=UPI0034D3A342
MADERKRKVLLSLFVAMEDSDMDDSSGDEEEEFINFLPALMNECTQRQDRTQQRVIDYFELTISRLPDIDFKSHFRLRRESLEILCQRLCTSEYLQKGQKGGREEIKLAKKLCMYLWFSSTKETNRSISSRFGVTYSSVGRVVDRVTKAISAIMTKQEIVWPTGNRRKVVARGFQAMKGIENVIGAIDGSHIPISERTEDNKVYVNRKHFESVVLQGCCDHVLRFTDCFTGFPGSTHDARVYENSTIRRRIIADPVSMVPEGSIILGDSAYKLETYMMVPYKDTGNMNRTKNRYNYKHSATRMVIERAFGLLKGRFCRLKYLELRNLEPLNKFIIAMCTLHNFCINEDLRLNLDPSEVDFDIEFEDVGHDAYYNEIYGAALVDAERKRDEIAESM